MNTCELDQCSQPAVDTMIYLNPNIGPYRTCWAHAVPHIDPARMEA